MTLVVVLHTTTGSATCFFPIPCVLACTGVMIRLRRGGVQRIYERNSQGHIGILIEASWVGQLYHFMLNIHIYIYLPVATIAPINYIKAIQQAILFADADREKKKKKVILGTKKTCCKNVNTPVEFRISATSITSFVSVCGPRFAICGNNREKNRITWTTISRAEAFGKQCPTTRVLSTLQVSCDVR